MLFCFCDLDVRYFFPAHSIVVYLFILSIFFHVPFYAFYAFYAQQIDLITSFCWRFPSYLEDYWNVLKVFASIDYFCVFAFRIVFDSTWIWNSSIVCEKWSKKMIGFVPTHFSSNKKIVSFLGFAYLLLNNVFEKISDKVLNLK